MSLNDILTIDRSLICKEVNVRFMPIGIYGNRTSYSKSVSTVIGGGESYLEHGLLRFFNQYCVLSMLLFSSGCANEHFWCLPTV